jgi:beta-lactamase superfamily II metal-dependent hydrolase
MLLAEADQKRVLLTGDGRGDHLVSGLEQAGLLDAQGTMHVDVLKVAHHGSDRNATRAFFGSVSADTYVISADGTYGNPDLATLTWIVEAADKRRREIELVLTNEPPSVAKLVVEYPPSEYGYKATLLQPDQHSRLVRISPS